MPRTLLLLLLTVFLIEPSGHSQTNILQKDTLSMNAPTPSFDNAKPFHYNVIKFNPTPMLLWKNVRNLTFSYERLINKNMSLGLQAGYLLLPRMVKDTVAGLINITGGKKQGINLAFDYRYYPLSRNRRPAPDGLYIGSFLSYYGFNFTNNMEVLYTDNIQEGSLNGRFNVVNLGVDVGYQFIFWKRFSVDLLMFGPAVSFYQGRVGISGNFDPGEIEEIDEDLVNALIEEYPWLVELFSKQKLEFTGSRTKFGMGLRFSIQLGFHF